MVRRRVIFILLLLAAGGGSSVAEELQWLSYRTAAQADRVVGDMLMDWIDLSAEAPEGVNLPKFEGNQQYFGTWKSPMVEKGFRRLAFDRKHSNGPYDNMYFDSNGDGELSDEKVIKANQAESNYSYLGPVPVYFEGEDGPITYHLNFRFIVGRDNIPTQVHVTSGGWYEGYVKVDGKKKFCMLIDYNANGTFDDKSIQWSKCDRIRIGKKDERDTRFVGNYIEIDGDFYRPEIARDGAYIKLEAAEDIRFGKVKMQEAITGFSAGGENGLFAVRLEKGTGELPVGKYCINYWAIERKDEGGSTWELKGQWFDEKGNFEVSENGETELAVGEPVICSLTSREGDSRHYFDQGLRGELGERISLTRSGSRPRAPKLHIKSADGKYDRTFNFEYG